MGDQQKIIYPFLELPARHNYQWNSKVILDLVLNASRRNAFLEDTTKSVRLRFLKKIRGIATSILSIPAARTVFNRLKKIPTEEWKKRYDEANHKLFALLISPGYSKDKAQKIATDLLEAFDHNLLDMFTATIEQLTQVKGIGFVKACQILAAFELWKRSASHFKENHPRITSIQDVIKLLGPHMQFLKQEEFRVLLLDSRRRLIRHCRVSLGSLNSVMVEPRDVFRPALAAGAKSIVLVHNHPSGDPTPSEEDHCLTQQLCLAGIVVDIKVLDHVIIGIPDCKSLLGYGSEGCSRGE